MSSRIDEMFNFHQTALNLRAARQELISAQYALITAQSDALQNGAIIEQLTAQPLLPPLASDASGIAQEPNQ